MRSFGFVLYAIYMLGRYFISKIAIPAICDMLSNVVTIYVSIFGILSLSHTLFPDQSVIIIGNLLDVVNKFYLIWPILGIGVIQLILKHKKFIVSDMSSKIKWFKAIQSASLESAALILLIVGSIIQLSLLFLPPGIVVVEAIIYCIGLRIFWYSRSKWAYSTARLL